MTQQTPYIGSKISLISKLDIRYEGILYTVDSKESTIALSKVRSFGTEDRNAAHVVPPQDEVYDYIIFKANDIKDLIVCETPKPPAPGLPYDPAILSVSQGEKPPTPAPAADNEKSGSKSANRNTYNNSDKPPGDGEKSGYKSQHRNSYNNRDKSSPTPVGNERSGYKPQNRNNTYNNQNNRGGPRNQNNRDQNNRDQNNRGGPRNHNNRGNGGNRPHGPRNNLKFENDYDFEKAYEQFKETLEAIVGDVQNIKIGDSHDNDAGSVKSGDDNESFYDKNKSFFDSISCEALEKEEGKNTRPDWRKERLTNQETFGQQSVRSFGYRRGGYNNGGGGGGYNNRGGYGHRQHGYDNRGYDNNRQHGYDNNRHRGYDNNRQHGGYYNQNNRGGSRYQNNRDQNNRGGPRNQSRDNENMI